MWFVFFMLITYLVFRSHSRTFTRCELYYELDKHGFPHDELRDWVCLVEAESSRRTDAIGGPDADGSYDYGLFQINDRYWCSNSSRPGKECNLRCKDLLLDNISKATACTKKIFKEHGFYAWVGWVNECEEKSLPNLGNCIRSNKTK